MPKTMFGKIWEAHEVRGPEQVAPIAATEPPPDPGPANQHASARR